MGNGILGVLLGVTLGLASGCDMSALDAPAVEVRWTRTQLGITQGLVYNRTGRPLPDFRLILPEATLHSRNGFYVGASRSDLLGRFTESYPYAGDAGETITLGESRAFSLPAYLPILPVERLEATFGPNDEPVLLVQTGTD